MDMETFVAGYFETTGSDRFPRKTAERDLSEIYEKLGKVSKGQARGIYLGYTIGTISGRTVAAVEAPPFCLSRQDL